MSLVTVIAIVVVTLSSLQAAWKAFRAWRTKEPYRFAGNAQTWPLGGRSTNPLFILVGALVVISYTGYKTYVLSRAGTFARTQSFSPTVPSGFVDLSVGSPEENSRQVPAAVLAGLQYSGAPVAGYDPSGPAVFMGLVKPEKRTLSAEFMDEVIRRFFRTDGAAGVSVSQDPMVLDRIEGRAVGRTRVLVKSTTFVMTIWVYAATAEDGYIVLCYSIPPDSEEKYRAVIEESVKRSLKPSVR